MQWQLLLTYMLAIAIPVSMPFNIEITSSSVYTGEQEDFFGYKVLQFMSGTNKGIIVTAPLHLNGSGGVCKPGQTQNPQCFSPKEISHTNRTIPVKHFGLTMAADSTGSQFTVCSPSIAHECNENSYLNSVCYNMADDLHPVQSFTPAFQECTKKTVDLVFLFDGSGSMATNDFEKNKKFIVEIIDSLKNSSIKFAAAQFSAEYRKVFDFNDYQAGTALKKLDKELHMMSLTNTHKALKFVLDDLFENSGAGATSDATKVLVIITDGDPSDTDKQYDIIKIYNKKNIIRFVIGVKVATMDKFTDIASQPTEKYAFKIENYDGLTGLLENLQKKIFTMEGSEVARGGNWTDELSQSGFTAVVYNGGQLIVQSMWSRAFNDTLILGSVGSKNWRGSLREINKKNEIQIEDPDMEKDSYMGYSISVGKKNNAPLYFTGAPRFQHVGQVVLFMNTDKTWTIAQRLNGDQIGAYFGAELCSVDVDTDNNTDFLLVGAPLFYQPQEKREGQIYVYALTDEMLLKSKRNVTVSSMGRFGTTISSLADLNGDGLRDVAVGAPLEDDNRGVVYIYLGHRHDGIRATFSQRIMGQQVLPGLRFFGQAIDGNIDLGEDGLPDIVIGSQGKAVVLRSRPVFNVTARLSFLPDEINTDKFDCLGNTEEMFNMVTLTACFEMAEATKSKAGTISTGLNISYTLDIDPTRPTSRGFFSPTDKKARNLTSVYELKDKEMCLNYPIYMPKCVKDTLTPICIKLNFSQADDESGVLNVDSKKQAGVEIPFKKHCANNDTCIAELEVEFNFMSSALLVAEDNYFNVSVKLSNHGDDSYNTSLTMHYPPGLSFSTMTLNEASRPTLHMCHDLEVLDKTVCSVSHPVYRSKSHATFKTSFHIMTDYEWNNTISVTVNGNSDNANSTRKSSVTKTIPVQFQIKMAVIVKEDTITYLNFTSEDSAPKKLEIIYKINNPGVKAFPLNVSLIFPTELDHNFEMKNYQVFVEKNKTQCSNIQSAPCSPENHSKISMCDTFILDKESSIEFKLSGDVQFRDLKEHAANIAFLKRYTGESAEVKFRSFISVNYDKERYVLDSHKSETKGFPQEKTNEMCLRKDNSPTMKWTEVRVEFVIPVDQKLIVATGVGLGLLLLIIITIIMVKMGCFKRRKLPDEDEEQSTEERLGLAAAPPKSTPVPTKETVSQSETGNKAEESLEDEKLLHDNANGN